MFARLKNKSWLLALVLGLCACTSAPVQKPAEENDPIEEQTPAEEQGKVNYTKEFVPVTDAEESEYIYVRDFYGDYETIGVIEGAVADYEVGTIAVELEDKEMEALINEYLNNEVQRITQLDLPAYPGIRKVVQDKKLTGSIYSSCTQKNIILSCEINRSLQHEDTEDYNNSIYISDSFYYVISAVDGHRITLQEVLNRKDAYEYINELFVEQFDYSIGPEQDILESMIGDFEIDENTPFTLSYNDNAIMINFSNQVQRVDTSAQNFYPLTMNISTEDVLPIIDITYDESYADNEYTKVFLPSLSFPRVREAIPWAGGEIQLWIADFLAEDEQWMSLLEEDIENVKAETQERLQEYWQEDIDVSMNVDLGYNGCYYNIRYNVYAFLPSSDVSYYTNFTHHYKEDGTELKLEELFDDPNEILNHPIYQAFSNQMDFSWDLRDSSFGTELELTACEKSDAGYMQNYDTIPISDFQTLNLLKWNR